jgi:hypothetical protein
MLPLGPSNARFRVLALRMLGANAENGGKTGTRMNVSFSYSNTNNRRFINGVIAHGVGKK